MNAIEQIRRTNSNPARDWTCAVSNRSNRSNAATRSGVVHGRQAPAKQGLPATRCTKSALFELRPALTGRLFCEGEKGRLSAARLAIRRREPCRSSPSAQAPLKLSAGRFCKTLSRSHLRISSPKEFQNLSAQVSQDERDGRQECLPDESGNHIQHRLAGDDQRAVVAVD